MNNNLSNQGSAEGQKDNRLSHAGFQTSNGLISSFLSSVFSHSSSEWKSEKESDIQLNEYLLPRNYNVKEGDIFSSSDLLGVSNRKIEDGSDDV